MHRRILHFRVISFALAVARVQDPSLRGKPLVIASGDGPRSIVLSASDEARGDGVRRGLPLSEALRRCRGLSTLQPDPDLHRRAAGAVGRVLHRFTPLVEPSGGGRFFADLTGTHRLFGAAVDVAARIQKEIGEGLRLPANTGVAANKLVSFVSTRVIRPVGLCDILPGTEAAFLKPVAVGNLPAVDPEVEGRLLSDLNVVHAGQLAVLPPSLLADAFGRKGPLLHRQARGEDDTPVRPPRRVPVIEERMPPLAEETNDDAILAGALRILVERGCRRLRGLGLLAGRAVLSVRYADGMRAARRIDLTPPLGRDWALFRKLRSLFETAVARRDRVRSMSLRLERLGPAASQMLLFPEMGGEEEEGLPRLSAGRERSLLAALDRIRGKHGEGALMIGGAIPGASMLGRSMPGPPPHRTPGECRG